ncbi:MAG: hypothetical protein ACK4YP_10600 [Myxococcota bacterium]
MTDRFLPIDAALWSVAVALFAFALWLTRRDLSLNWDPAVFFGGALAALFGKGKLPLAEGPVPPEGWDGEPEDLEDVYDPKERLGPDLSWRDVATWSAPVRATVARRLADVRVVWLEPPAVAIAEVEPVITTPDALPTLFARPDERFVLCASAEAQRALGLLHDDATLRDRLRAVLLVAPRLDRAWLETHFTHTAFDVEVSRPVPYLTLRAGPTAAEQLLPEPPVPPSGMATVAVMDLGVLPPELLGDERVGRALAATLAVLP